MSSSASHRRVSDDQWYKLIIAVASDRLEVNEIADLLQTMLSADHQSTGHSAKASLDSDVV